MEPRAPPCAGTDPALKKAGAAFSAPPVRRRPVPFPAASSLLSGHKKNGAEFFLRSVCDVILTTYASCTVDSLPFLACHALMYSQASSALSAR